MFIECSDQSRPSRRQRRAGGFTRWAAAGTVAVSVGAVALTGSAGAQTTTTTNAPDPAAATNPGDFAVALFQNEFQGNFDVLWGTIDPAQQQGLNQDDWTSCAFQAAVQAFGLDLGTVTAGSQQPQPVQDYGPVKAQATKVTVNAQLSVNGQSQTASPTYYVEQGGGGFKVLLPTADFDAIKARNCPPGLGAPKLPAGMKQADMEPGYWFETTNVFPSGGQFKVHPDFPTDPYASDVGGREASISYNGPGTDQGSGEQGVQIHVFGPSSYKGATSLGSAGSVISKQYLKKVQGPSKTRLGGKPALGYSGVNGVGNDEWLVVTYVKGKGGNAGVYTLSLSAPRSSFSKYTKTFSTIQRSFQFWPH